MEHMLNLQNIGKVYRNGALQLHALHNIDLSVKPGEFLAILGPSGAGKSTLLNVLGLLEGYDEGSYCINGQNVASLSDTERARIRNQSLGFVFQSYNLIADMSLKENLMVPLFYAGLSASECERRVRVSMEEHGLLTRQHCRPSELSGGQQQRVAIARALILQPAVVLADEPTGNLDSLSARQVMQGLSKAQNKGTTIIMVTHSEELARHAHRRLYMLDGQLNADLNLDVDASRLSGRQVKAC